MVEWRPIRLIDFEQKYEVSDDGQLRSRDVTIVRANGRRLHRKGHICKSTPHHKWGYYQYQLNYDGQHKTVMIHCLVADAFIGVRPEGTEVNHKDGDKSHNHFANLEYVTPSQNSLHRHRILKMQLGDRHWRSKLTATDIPRIRLLIEQGRSLASIGREYSVNSGAIHHVKSGHTWSHIL